MSDDDGGRSMGDGDKVGGAACCSVATVRPAGGVQLAGLVRKASRGFLFSGDDNEDDDDEVRRLPSIDDGDDDDEVRRLPSVRPIQLTRSATLRRNKVGGAACCSVSRVRPAGGVQLAGLVRKASCDDFSAFPSSPKSYY